MRASEFIRQQSCNQAINGSLTEIIAATDLDEKPVIEGSTISTEKQKALSGSFTDNKKSSKNSRQVVTHHLIRSCYGR